MAAQQGIVTVNGYLGADPVRLGGGNTPVSVFNMGTTPGFRNQQTGQWVDMPTTWLRVKAFRSLAANVLDSLHKGDPVIVTGQIGTEEWQNKDGVQQSTMVITATNIGHDLNAGRTVFTKTSMRAQYQRNPAAGQPSPQPAQQPGQPMPLAQAAGSPWQQNAPGQQGMPSPGMPPSGPPSAAPMPQSASVPQPAVQIADSGAPSGSAEPAHGGAASAIIASTEEFGVSADGGGSGAQRDPY